MKDANMIALPASEATAELTFTQSAPLEETRNTMLAAALVTLGIPLAESSGGGLVTGDGIIAPGGSITWCFEPVSSDGRYRTSEMMNLWTNREWLTNPENDHPLAYIACAMHNYKRLLDHVKQSVPIGLIRSGKKMALVRLDAPDAFVGIIERRMNRR